MSDPCWREQAGIGMSALNGSLVIVLRALAEQNGGKSGPWLDALEDEALHNVKTMTSEGTALEGEALGMKNAMIVIGRAFQQVRDEFPI
jgi:hypothetical protein